MNAPRIPQYPEKTFDGMLAWFAEMSVHDLLFHPDDAPEEIISASSGRRFFTHAECPQLGAIMNEMFFEFGDKVYEAAYPIFMNRMGICLDA